MLWFGLQLVQAVAITAVIATDPAVNSLGVRIYRTVIQSPNATGGVWKSTYEMVGDLSLHWLYVFVPWCAALQYAVWLWMTANGGTVFGGTNTVVEIKPVHRAMRWIEYALSASLMTVVVGCMSSVTDLNALLGLVASNVAVQYCGWLADSSSRSMRDRWLAFGVGCVVFVMTWAPLLATFQNTVDASEDVPDFVTAVVWGITLAYLTFPTVLVLRLVGVLDQSSEWTRSSDNWFDVASFVAKALLDWTIVIGIINW